MAAEWYFQELGRPYGPFTASELERRARQGDIGPETLVRFGLTGRWVVAEKVRGLFGRAASRRGGPAPRPIPPVPPAVPVTPWWALPEAEAPPATPPPLPRKTPVVRKSGAGAWVVVALGVAALVTLVVGKPTGGRGPGPARPAAQGSSGEGPSVREPHRGGDAPPAALAVWQGKTEPSGRAPRNRQAEEDRRRADTERDRLAGDAARRQRERAEQDRARRVKQQDLQTRLALLLVRESRCQSELLSLESDLMKAKQRSDAAIRSSYGNTFGSGGSGGGSLVSAGTTFRLAGDVALKRSELRDIQSSIRLVRLQLAGM